MNNARWAEKLDLVLEVYSKSGFLKNWNNPYKMDSYYYTPSHLLTKETGPDPNGKVLKKVSVLDALEKLSQFWVSPINTYIGMHFGK